MEQLILEAESTGQDTKDVEDVHPEELPGAATSLAMDEKGVDNDDGASTDRKYDSIPRT